MQLSIKQRCWSMSGQQGTIPPGFSVSSSRYYDGAQIIKVDTTRAEATTAQSAVVLFKADAISDLRATSPHKRSTHGRPKAEFSSSVSATR
jgi:hypothetical protein